MREKRKTLNLTGPVDSGAPATYASTFVEIKERIRKAQHAALKSVNKQLVGLYWDIGRIIGQLIPHPPISSRFARGWGADP